MLKEENEGAIRKEEPELVDDENVGENPVAVNATALIEVCSCF